jgi:hypothetical protein
VAEKTRDDRIWWRGVEFDHFQDSDGNQAEGVDDANREPKGWDRASLDLNTHPLHPFPNVTRSDLMIPSAADRLALLAACLACGACIAVLWVYFPLFFIQIVADVELGAWVWISMVAAAAASGLLLFLYASAREQRYADTL